MTDHERWMHRCLDLAKNGRPAVRTNPMVGCCIVFEDRIIAEGFHASFGAPHAEAQALSKISNQERSLLNDATLYVNLEPCNHQGKTPPCSDLIINSGLKKVVFAQPDPNPQATGGLSHLRAAGIEVTTNILIEEAKALNKGFTLGITKQRPIVTLKWAESSDGFIGSSDDRIVISNRLSHLFAHDLRRNNNAILIGAETLRVDDPALTTRMVPGSNPLRIILAGKKDIPAASRIFLDNNPVIVFAKHPPEIPDSLHVTIRKYESETLDLHELMRVLYTDLNIGFLLVEGGRAVLQQFIDLDLWDTAYRIISPQSLSSGIRAPKMISKITTSFHLGDNCVERFDRISV